MLPNLSILLSIVTLVTSLEQQRVAKVRKGIKLPPVPPLQPANNRAQQQQQQQPDQFVDRDPLGVQFHFYDVTLDEQLCEGADQELRSEAVEDHIYLGRLLETSRSLTSQMCIAKCYQHKQCTSVNYYKPRTFGKQGFCELLAGTQWDNPKWMRRYTGGVYYERIVCQKIGGKLPPYDSTQFRINEPKDSRTTNFLNSIFAKLRGLKLRANRSKR